jgi:hypothetical protein
MLIEIPDPIELRYELEKGKAAEQKAWEEQHLALCVSALKKYGKTYTWNEAFAQQCKNAGYFVDKEILRGLPRWKVRVNASIDD